MAFLSFTKVRIAGVAAGVPKNVVSNLDHPSGVVPISGNYTPEAFVELTGVRERRVSETLCTSDLCFAAAERLLADLGWRKDEIDAILFVSQTPDYALPATACILQNRLGLGKETYAADISLGCSGWVYGLSQAMALAQNGDIRKVLLCCGDAKRRTPQQLDPLFGCAGTVTAIEYAPDAGNAYRFHLGTDGSGFDAIIIPDSGSRNQVKPASFVPYGYEGRVLNRMQTRMKGLDVFAFGITTAPKSVRRLAEHYGFDYQDYDYFLFHQANLKMNRTIAKKLKLDPAKVPSGLCDFGNTSSASIPLLMVTRIRDQIDGKATRIIGCGFGVGLSWGTVAFEESLKVSALVEVDELAEPHHGAEEPDGV